MLSKKDVFMLSLLKDSISEAEINNTSIQEALSKQKAQFGGFLSERGVAILETGCLLYDIKYSTGKFTPSATLALSERDTVILNLIADIVHKGVQYKNSLRAIQECIGSEVIFGRLSKATVELLVTIF